MADQEIMTRGDRRFRLVQLVRVDVEVQGTPKSARVRLVSASGERFEVQTAMDGRATLEDVPTGRYTCQTQRAGRAPGKPAAILVPAGAARIRVVVGPQEAQDRI